MGVQCVWVTFVLLKVFLFIFYFQWRIHRKILHDIWLEIKKTVIVFKSMWTDFRPSILLEISKALLSFSKNKTSTDFFFYFFEIVFSISDDVYLVHLVYTTHENRSSSCTLQSALSVLDVKKTKNKNTFTNTSIGIKKKKKTPW